MEPRRQFVGYKLDLEVSAPAIGRLGSAVSAGVAGIGALIAGATRTAPVALPFHGRTQALLSPGAARSTILRTCAETLIAGAGETALIGICRPQVAAGGRASAVATRDSLIVPRTTGALRPRRNSTCVEAFRSTAAGTLHVGTRPTGAFATRLESTAGKAIARATALVATGSLQVGARAAGAFAARIKSAAGKAVARAATLIATGTLHVGARAAGTFATRLESTARKTVAGVATLIATGPLHVGARAAEAVVVMFPSTRRKAVTGSAALIAAGTLRVEAWAAEAAVMVMSPSVGCKAVAGATEAATRVATGSLHVGPRAAGTFGTRRESASRKTISGTRSTALITAWAARVWRRAARAVLAIAGTASREAGSAKARALIATGPAQIGGTARAAAILIATPRIGPAEPATRVARVVRVAEISDLLALVDLGFQWHDRLFGPRVQRGRSQSDGGHQDCIVGSHFLCGVRSNALLPIDATVPPLCL